jgi:hypothetical protein
MTISFTFISSMIEDIVTFRWIPLIKQCLVFTLFLSLIHAYMRSLLSHHLYSSPSFSLKVINLGILDSVAHLFVLPFSFEME